MLLLLEMVTVLVLVEKENAGSNHKAVFLTAHFPSLLFAVNGTDITYKLKQPDFYRYNFFSSLSV